MEMDSMPSLSVAITIDNLGQALLIIPLIDLNIW